MAASSERLTYVALVAALGIFATAASTVEVTRQNLKSTVTEVVDAKLADLGELKTRVAGLDTRMEQVERTLSELVLLLRPVR